MQPADTDCCGVIFGVEMPNLPGLRLLAKRLCRIEQTTHETVLAGLRRPYEQNPSNSVTLQYNREMSVQGSCIQDMQTGHASLIATHLRIA